MFALENMDSPLLKDGKSKKRNKCRKKHIDHPKLPGTRNLDKGTELLFNPKDERKSQDHASERRKILMLQKRKNTINISRLTSNACYTVNHDYSEISNVADIEKVGQHVSSKDISVSLKAKKKLKKSKKKLNNKNYDPAKNKCSDGVFSKTIDGKRKRLHSDAEVSPIKKSKDVKHNKCVVSESSKICGEFKSKSSNFKDNNKNDDKQNAVFPQKTQFESSDSGEEDQEIRNELRTSSIYKKIKKMMKDNPSLKSVTNFCEEESFETELAESLGESELEEQSIEFVGDTSSDGESEYLPKDLLTPTSKKFKKDKLVSEKTQKESWIVKNEQVATTPSTTSTCNFNRTKKKANRDGKAISKKEPSTLRDKALEKLQGAKFRYLNERLYTENGKDSFNYFQSNRDEYMDYHRGYSLQVAKWPLNPVDKIISSLLKMKKNMTIADMGCGDAKIARTLTNCSVHSFDLVALNDFVIPCNVSKVPLSNESVDVVIFCLSLMGTNLKEYLQEAYRITKFGGILLIAEVESRVPNLDQFIKSIEALGFSLGKKNMEHKLFVFLEFNKMKKKKKGATVQDITLKPCLYKKR